MQWQMATTYDDDDADFISLFKQPVSTNQACPFRTRSSAESDLSPIAAPPSPSHIMMPSFYPIPTDDRVHHNSPVRNSKRDITSYPLSIVVILRFLRHLAGARRFPDMNTSSIWH